MTTVRRTKWHPQRPPTPRILHLPRRNGRRQGAKQVVRNSGGLDQGLRRQPQEKTETLFGQERAICYTIPPVVLLNSGERGRKERVVVEEEEMVVAAGMEEERKYKDKVGIWEEFQAEILRGECKFLRMERQIAVKRLGRERVFMENTLKSAVHSLISAKRKIGEGQNVNLVLEEEIEELAKKLVELQRSCKKNTRRDPELLNGNRASSNFDKQARLHQRQVEKISGLSGEECAKNIQEIAKASLLKCGTENGSTKEEYASDRGCGGFTDVEILRRKMEGLSEGKLLKKMGEEYGSMLSRMASTSAANSASTSRRYEFLDLSSLQEPLQEKKLHEKNVCAGQCKVIVRRIMEQVRAETEQWSQMQEMLGQVREEMEKLQASRDFWEGRAIDSDYKIQSLNVTVQDWKQRLISLEIKEKQLQDLAKSLQEQLDRVMMGKGPKESATVSWEAPQPQEREKRGLTCRVKGNSQTNKSCGKTRDSLHDKKKINHRGSTLASPSSLPFQDIGNFSHLLRQNGKRWVFPLQSH